MQVSAVLQMVGTSSTKACAGKRVGMLKEEQGDQNVRTTASGGQSAVNEVGDGGGGPNHTEPCRPWTKVAFQG